MKQNQGDQREGCVVDREQQWQVNQSRGGQGSNGRQEDGRFEAIGGWQSIGLGVVAKGEEATKDRKWYYSFLKLIMELKLREGKVTCLKFLLLNGKIRI